MLPLSGSTHGHDAGRRYIKARHARESRPLSHQRCGRRRHRRIGRIAYFGGAGSAAAPRIAPARPAAWDRVRAPILASREETW